MKNDPLSPKAQALIAFIEEQGYICPWGQAWDSLWKMLPDRKRVGEAWEPALPLILSGWYISGDLDKALLFREHIDWANQHGVIDKVDEYLRGLPPESWHKRRPSTDGNGEMKPLARVTEAYIRERIAAGHTVTKIKPTPSNTMQATFVPRRREEPTPPSGDMPIGDDGQEINLFEEGRNDPDQPLSAQAQALWDEILSRGRICPAQEPWYRLWMSLPCKYMLAGRYMPPEPPHPNHWDRTPDDEKRALLLRHIRWADQNRVLNKTASYLKNLPEEVWVNVSDGKQP